MSRNEYLEVFQLDFVITRVDCSILFSQRGDHIARQGPLNTTIASAPGISKILRAKATDKTKVVRKWLVQHKKLQHSNFVSYVCVCSLLSMVILESIYLLCNWY